MHVVLVDIQADLSSILQVLGRPGVTWFGMAFFVRDYHVQGHIGIETIINYLKGSKTGFDYDLDEHLFEIAL